VGLANLGSESETCVGSRVRLVGVFISFEKNFYQLSFTPTPLSGSLYRSFRVGEGKKSGEGGSGTGEGEGKITVAHLYRSIIRVGTIVLTLYQSVATTGTNVIASHLYRSAPPPSKNVWHLYRVGGR
jgi:hypothetical protein